MLHVAVLLNEFHVQTKLQKSIQRPTMRAQQFVIQSKDCENFISILIDSIHSPDHY